MTGRTDGLWQGQPDRWLHCPPAPRTRLGPSRAVGGSRESSGQNRVALNRTASTNIYESPVLLKGEDKKKTKQNTSFLLDKETVPGCLCIFKFIKKSPKVPAWPRAAGFAPHLRGLSWVFLQPSFQGEEKRDTPGFTGRAGEAPPAGFVHESDSALFKAKVRSGVCGCTRRLIKTRCQVPPCPAMGPLPLGK